MTVVGFNGLAPNVSPWWAEMQTVRPESRTAPDRPNRVEAGDKARRSDPEAPREDPNAPRGADGQPLSEEEQRQIDELAKRDREVRRHEEAHMAAGAGIVLSGPHYTYQTGPDARQYAIGGEVQLDTSKERDPEATLRKAQQIQRAALAPAEPSPQDRQVAAEGARMEAEARQDVEAEREAEGPGGDRRDGPGEANAGATDYLRRAYAQGSQGPSATGQQLAVSG